MFCDNSPMATLINVGMLGLSFLCGRKSGESSALKIMEARHRESEILELKRQIAELNRKLSTPPPIPPKI